MDIAAFLIMNVTKPSKKIIPTGIKLKIPKGYEVQQDLDLISSEQ